MRWRSWQESKILPKSFITQLSIQNESLQCNTWRCLGLRGAEAGRVDPQPMRTEAKSAAPWNPWRAKTTWDSVAAAYWLAIFAPSSTKPCPKLQDSPPILILGHLTPTLLNKFIYRTGRWRNSRSSKRHKLRQSTDSNAGIAGVSSVCVPVPSLTTRAQLARRLNEWWNPNPPWLESLRGFCKNARTSHHGNLTEMRFLNPDSRALHTMAEDREAVEFPKS